jgi:[NiFe] hydrogenase diaphorase moiety small subunit
MSQTITFTIDGVEVAGRPGQTIMQAADAAGIYIPRLCAHSELSPQGSCRVCTVMANGRPQTACTQPIAQGMVVENDTEKLRRVRRDIVEMLFVEGNHFCMVCEKSGNCELQAMAYRLGITGPKYPYMFPKRQPDASHQDILIDRDRCILCARCIRASRQLDGKCVFDFVGRGAGRRIAADAAAGLGDTDAAVTDRAMEVCPVGAILKKRVGYAVPIGRRTYDQKPIGTDIEAGAAKMTP